MTSHHLTTGSEKPPMIEGKLRLYQMEYCPYSQRVRLILMVKRVPFDIVNINLMKKPEWYYEINPEGKVPVLVHGTEVVTDSIKIAEYLDQKFPSPPLFPSEDQAKNEDKKLIKEMEPLIELFHDLVTGKKTKSSSDWLEELEPKMNIFEKELKKRGSIFFSGDKPGMVDYMLWPWAERSPTVTLVLKEMLPVTEDKFVNIQLWKKAMRELPEVEEIYHGPEKFYKTILFKTENVEADYDSI